MTATIISNRIDLWLDTTSDPEVPAWIVSLDRIGADGGAETTATLASFEDYEPAYNRAMAEGIARDLRVAEIGETADRVRILYWATPTSYAEARAARWPFIGEWGYPDGRAGWVFARPGKVAAVKAAWDAIDDLPDHTDPLNKLDDVFAAGGLFLEDTGE